MPGCRISKVTDKASGRSIHVLPSRGVVGETDSVIRVLENMLRDARDGRFRAVALAAVMMDGDTFTIASSSSVRQALLGSVIDLQHRLVEMKNL